MSTPRMDEFYDIYGIWHIPWWQRTVVKNVVWALAIILLMTLIIFLVKKFSKRKIKLSACDVALRDLASLGTSDILNEHKSRVFYSRLTETIKKYLVSRYGFDIYGKTDKEVLTYLDDQVTFPRDLLPVLQEILSHASAIKFANVSGVVEQMEKDLALSVRLIKETMPLPSR